MTKLFVYKYSPDNGIFSGIEEALPHPKTGEYQIPFYTTKLVPPDKRPGFQIVFMEKEGSLPGMGEGVWDLVKEVEKVYYSKINGSKFILTNMNATEDLSNFTTKPPESNDYNISYIENVVVFDNELDKWVVNFEELKSYIIKLLKISRDKIFMTPVLYKNILFDTNQASRQRINENIIRFSVESVNMEDIFDTNIQLDLDQIKKSNIIPWIDANNKTVNISPNMLVGLNYIIGFKDLIVVKLYNELRHKIQNVKTIDKLYKIIPSMNQDIIDGCIHEFENLKFDEETILTTISKLDVLNINKYTDKNKVPTEPAEEESKEEVIEETIETVVPNVEPEDISKRGTPVYDNMGNVITYIKKED